jgi:tetratricopeptide (TPR) repeat protein
VIFLTYVALFGWIPFCLGVFMAMPAQRAVVVCTIGAWILLPPIAIDTPGLPPYDKLAAGVAGITLATLLFEPHRLIAFRPRWLDLPILIWSLCPIVSSLSNDLGLYDGLSTARGNFIAWGLPFLIGRLYFGDREGMRELMIGIVIGGLLCVLPCLYEIRMSPVLASQVYGLGHYEGTRMGGFRPILFFSVGLELGMWMTAVCLSVLWLWKSGTLTRIGAYPVGTLIVPTLLVTTLLCRSTGALFLLMVGFLALWLSTRFQAKLFLWVLILLPPIYYAVRIPDLWSGQEVASLVKTYFDEERGTSFDFRMNMENVLAARAMEQPIWGWGGWGRNRAVSHANGMEAVPDGMWIIWLGVYGFVGLASWTLLYLTGPILFAARYPVRSWATREVGPLAAAAALLCIYLCDCLMNAFNNLIYTVAAGGLVSAVLATNPPKFGRSQATTSRLPRHNRHGARRETAESVAAEPEGRPGDTRLLPALTSRESLASRYIDLARALGAQRQFEKARASWTHALDLLTEAAPAGPDDPEGCTLRWDCANDFAWFLLNLSEADHESGLQAIRLATQATEAQPENAVYWNTLGTARYRAGDFGGAIAALERSIDLNRGGTAADHLLMAMAHAREGRRPEARDWYARAALRIEPNRPGDPGLLALYKEAGATLNPDDLMTTTTSES